ncbi:MAG: hypothetical protein ACKO96_15415 [Flammeovirgaceae bacterium]
MKRITCMKYTLNFILIVLSINLYAQGEKKLTMSKDFWGYKFYEGGNLISKQQVMQLLQSNPEAIKLFKEGNANLVPAGIFGFAGGFMIGWPIGESLGGKKDPKWGLAAGGLALVVVGAVFEKSFKKKINHSFDVYNNEKVTSSLRISPAGTGFLITYTF